MEGATAVDKLRIGFFKFAADAIFYLCSCFYKYRPRLHTVSKIPAPRQCGERSVVRMKRSRDEILSMLCKFSEFRAAYSSTYFSDLFLFSSFLRNFCAMFISADIEKNLFSAQTPIARARHRLARIQARSRYAGPHSHTGAWW